MKVTYRAGVMTPQGEFPPEDQETEHGDLEAAQERAEAAYREDIGPEFITRWEAVDAAHMELFEDGHGGTGYYVREAPTPEPESVTQYQRGDRVELDFTDDPITRLSPGDRGTVQHQYGPIVTVSWDDGSTLAVLLDAGDRIHKVS